MMIRSFNAATENNPFTNDLPIQNCEFSKANRHMFFFGGVNQDISKIIYH